MKDFSLSSNQYRYVLAVVQEQSFSAAAQKLYMTQPALSQAIIKLENQLNIKIFDRSTVPVSLTDEGEVFVEIAKEILECERTLEDRLSFMDKTISGRLTVGMPSYRSVCYLPRLLPRFGEKYPNAAIEVVENEVYSLQKALLAGAIDLVISTQPLQESPYDFTILGREQVYLAVPPYHPLNNTHRQYQLTAAAIMDGRTHSVPYFPLQDAADERFILLRPSAKVTTRDFLGHIGLTLCKEAGFMPKLTPHTSRLEFAVSMVLANQALTFVTDTYIKYGNIAQHPVYYRIRAPHRNIAVLYRAGHVFQPIERAFINEIRGIL